MRRGNIGPKDDSEDENKDPDRYLSSTDPKHIAFTKNLDPKDHDCLIPAVNVHMIDKTNICSKIPDQGLYIGAQAYVPTYFRGASI